MPSTPLVVAHFVALLVAAVVLWVVLLRLGLQLANVPAVTDRRVALATAICVAVLLAINLALYLGPRNAKNWISIAIVEFVAAVLIPTFVIKSVFKIPLRRAFQAWLPTLGVVPGSMLFVLVVFRLFMYETFMSPSNAMAPTLLGNHWQGTCADCGKPAYCSPTAPQYVRLESAEAPLMICPDFHVTKPPDHEKTVFGSDRFLVCKFITPQRWDVIVFQNPETPTLMYLMRLVGLPGEEITIRDGQVLANGELLAPPESLGGIKYVSQLEGFHGELWGAPTKPARLADDEYFVLGDFSPQAKDSRIWERGAAGHHPYAVPASHLRGVVTQTYWPPSRWRSF